jgi:Leucine-rich repeat (LRR) protein
LEDIVHLDLHSNSLTGEIPSELAHCFRLKELNLSFNKLEDSIPAELGNLRKLETFHLQGNSIVDATMPPQICALREFGLSVLVADCAEEGKVSCECCSECQ